jgi:hypothetical protein
MYTTNSSFPQAFVAFSAQRAQNTINTEIMLIGCEERHIDRKANTLTSKTRVLATIMLRHIRNVI